jgi:hypothetical protein
MSTVSILVCRVKKICCFTVSKSLSQSGDESSTVTSNSSSNSSSSSSNSENKKEKYSRDEADQLKFDTPESSSTSQRPPGSSMIHNNQK